MTGMPCVMLLTLGLLITVMKADVIKSVVVIHPSDPGAPLTVAHQDECSYEHDQSLQGICVDHSGQAT